MKGTRKSFLIELEDQSWFPGWMRQYQVDFLGGVSKITGLYRPCSELLQSFNAEKIVDLASGNGQSTQTVLSELDNVVVDYTDKFPPQSRLKINRLDLLNDPLPDADLFTMFNGMHHFKEADISALVERIPIRSCFLFIEPIGPRLGSFVKVSLSTLFLPFFLVPFLKPFRWDRLFITYLLPLGPLICFYDGVISVLKSYSINELRSLASELSTKERAIKAGRVRSFFTSFYYLSS